MRSCASCFSNHQKATLIARSWCILNHSHACPGKKMTFQQLLLFIFQLLLTELVWNHTRQNPGKHFRVWNFLTKLTFSFTNSWATVINMLVSMSRLLYTVLFWRSMWNITFLISMTASEGSFRSYQVVQQSWGPLSLRVKSIFSEFLSNVISAVIKGLFYAFDSGRFHHPTHSFLWSQIEVDFTTKELNKIELIYPT